MHFGHVDTWLGMCVLESQDDDVGIAWPLPSSPVFGPLRRLNEHFWL